MIHIRGVRISNKNTIPPKISSQTPSILDAKISPPHVEPLHTIPMKSAKIVSPDIKAVVMDALRAALTESRTDDLIRKVTSKLPVWLRWLPIGRALDQALPDLLLDLIDDVL